ncbi:putative bifunctional diguanylate cyclase/phosphodiesterase [Litorivicinus lipolyticus]|uniref:putative bifunctional diguanylate cyclase/phosphodiesterase n=1 Tax=Litorivicinus lipolyticus TaxID=418701 RepID=UPI003B5A58D7
MKSLVLTTLLLASAPLYASTTWVIASASATDPWTSQVLVALGRNLPASHQIESYFLDGGNAAIALPDERPTHLVLLGDQAGQWHAAHPRAPMPSAQVRISAKNDRDNAWTQIIQRPNFGRELTLLRAIAPDIETIAVLSQANAPMRELAQHSIARAGFGGADLAQARPEHTAILDLTQGQATDYRARGFLVLSPWRGDIGYSAHLGGSLDGEQAGELLAKTLVAAGAQSTAVQLLQVSTQKIWADYAGLADLGIRPSRGDEQTRWVNHQGVTFQDRAASGVFFLIGLLIVLLMGVSWLAIRLQQQRHAQQALNRLALSDSLTGLSNREGFITQVDARMAHWERDQRHGLVFIDIDRFRNVNDRYGHDVGNTVIRLMAERLSQLVRTRDFVARLSADQFGVFLTQVNDNQGVEQIMDKLCEAIRLPVVIGELNVSIGASLGIAIFPDHGDTAIGLLRRAESAMSSAKQIDETSWSQYDDALRESQDLATQMAEDLRDALANNGLHLVYQPIVNLDDDSMSGVEALMRWQHPSLGMVPPPEILKIARESGQLLALGDCILMAACRQGHAWQRLGHELRMNVNVTPEQFSDTGLVARVQQMLFESGMDPRLLTLEITEDATLEQPAQAEAALERLNAIGVTAAIDDFGTGYSSLGRLKRFKLRALKIDRSFVTDLATDQNDRAINRAIVQIAQSMNIKVVAEGIETAEQLMLLRLEGCDYGQGYLFSKPIDARSVIELKLSNPWQKSA